MATSRHLIAFALVLCSMLKMPGESVGSEHSDKVDVTFMGQQLMDAWSLEEPVAVLVVHNGTCVPGNAVTIDGRKVSLNAAKPGVDTSIKLHFDGTHPTVCRVRVSGEAAKFIAAPGCCYFCTLTSAAGMNAPAGHPKALHDGGQGPAKLNSTELNDALGLNRNLFAKEKAQLDELTTRFEAVDKNRNWLDETINQIQLEQSHLTQEKKSLMALRDNMATLQQPGIANELAAVRTAIDTRLQALTKELQAKELALAPLQPRLDNANMQAEELEEKLETSKSALETLDRKFRSLRRSKNAQ